MHQQPPHTPLCFSTSRSKSGQVVSSQRLGVEAIHEMLENRMSLSADAEVARRQSGGTWLWVIDQFSIFHLSQASRIPESKVAPSQ
jgi:hypothetical protein